MIHSILYDNNLTLTAPLSALIWRAILALTLGYAAFIAEVFKAGIQAVGQGQYEAAQSLGLSA